MEHEFLLTMPHAVLAILLIQLQVLDSNVQHVEKIVTLAQHLEYLVGVTLLATFLTGQHSNV